MRVRNLCISVLIGAFAAAASAQIANNTSLVGTVSDSSGGVISGSKVTAIEENTKVHAQTVANDQGYYSISFIQPGTYDITVEKSGFKTTTKTGVVVPVDQAVRTDFTLAVGSTETVVTVSATTPPLSTDDATLGETFSTRAVEDLPISGHNALDIASLASNVYIGADTNYQGNPPGETFVGAGQRAIQNSLSLDGVSIMNNLITTTPDHPAADMISETQMQSGNYPAQYGSYLGIHINLVSKSGTDNLHGAVYDYVENTALNANVFTARPGSPKQVLHYNQYGFQVGGPVVIPKLYNGRNKTFFFGSYEKLNQIGQGSSIVSAITPAMENGDFSAAGIPQLYDPSTGQPYPGNQIPAAELTTPSAVIAKKYEAYMVPPNLSGIANNLNNAYPSELIIKQSIDRVDENIGEKVKLFVRYYYQDLTFVNGSNFAANASNGPTNSRNYAFGYTHIITPRLVNDLRFGVNKLIAENLNYWYTAGLKDAGTNLGIPGFKGDTLYNNPGVPVVTITNFQGVGNAGSNWFQDDRTYDLYEQLSYTRGRHNIMVGGEFRRLTLGREATNDPLGVINFAATTCTPGLSGACTTPLVSSGYSAADFVLGYINSDTTPIDTIKGSVGEWRDGFFALDNWQVFPKLTINYGLRYDLPTAPYSLNGYGRLLNDSQTALIPTSSATSGATYTPTPGYKFGSAQLDNVGPRLGLAYRVTDKTVIRAGMGFYYNANQLNTYTLLTSNYPFAAAVNYNTTGANPVTFANPTPGAGSAAPVAGTPGTYVAAYTPEPNLKTQRSYQWNADVGQELYPGAAFELQYLGSHSLHLDRSFYANEPINPVNTTKKSLNSQRPNQLFGSIRVFQEDEYSHYNALTAIMRQRLSHGFSGQVSYTWSHDLDLSNDSNDSGTTSQQYNIGADYGNALWDVRNRVVASFTYAMPELTGMSLLKREALGGWHVSGIVNIQSGMPFNVGMASSTVAAGVDQGTQRPSWVHPERANCSLKNAYAGLSHSTASCVDETAYQTAVNYSTGAVGYGDVHRNSLIGPGLQYENLAIFKDFTIWERMKFQFRSEAYNVFNHPSGANPPTSSNGLTINTTSGACAVQSCLGFPSGWGTITGVQQIPGTFSGARILELSGKLIF
ncbi:MAG TPA: TonB-dependent receptor [Acidobacteriaceae bacterium]|nr:TonB-dependent receptor [Acidobacteriaceae bacterium]